MRKRILSALALAGALLFAGSAARAQTQTDVSATVVDPIGIPYANGTFSVQLIPTGTNPTVNGNSIGGAFNGRLDANGRFNISLWPNASILPAATTWQFTICVSPGVAPPLGTGGQCTPPTAVTIAGATQSLSATLSAVAPALTTITLGAGSVTSVSGTAPIVATPNPITGVGAISCPTCNTSSASISGTIAAGEIAFGTALDTIGGDGNLLWDNATKYMIVGPPKTSFNALAQMSLDNSADGMYSFRSLDDLGRGESFQALAQFDPITSSLVGSASFYAILTNATNAPAGEWEGSISGISVDGTGNYPVGSIVAGFAVSSQVTSNVNVSQVRSIDVDIHNVGTGTLGLAYGILIGMGNDTTGTITTAADYFAQGYNNGGGGTIGTGYGYLSAAITGATVNYAYYAEDQGATGHGFYSAGGQNFLAASVGQTLPILDLDNGATDGPFAQFSVRGAGMTNSSGFNSLAEFRVNTGVATAVLDMSNASAPAGANLEFFFTNAGTAQIGQFDGATGAVTIGLGTDSSLNPAANVFGINAPLGVDAVAYKTDPVAFGSAIVCAAGTEGTIQAFTNSNTIVWGTNIAAGGANRVLGYCNGTAWTVAAK